MADKQKNMNDKEVEEEITTAVAALDVHDSGDQQAMLGTHAPRGTTQHAGRSSEGKSEGAPEPNVPQPQPADQAMVTVEYAFHVTNVSCTNDRPNWTALECHSADDPYFDGNVLLWAPCIFFITSKWDNDIFTRSVYPRTGIAQEKYWCIKVPLKYFDAYHILWIHEATTDSSTQVRLLLLKERHFQLINPNTREVLQRRAERYLRRERIADSDDYVYYSNNYRDPNTKYIVNFVIFEPFALPTWVPMEHLGPRPGVPRTESAEEIQKSPETKMGELIDRINSQNFE